jgi:hypothetical protein
MGVLLGNDYSSGRFLKQWAAVILGMAGLGLAALLMVMPRYHLQQQAVSMAREQAIRGNMRVLQVTLEQYLAEDGRGYPTFILKTDPRREDPMLDFLSSSLQRLQNPFDKGVPAVAVSRRDPPFWGLFKKGQIIYVPLAVKDGCAAGYVIYGMGDKGPLATVLERRPETAPQDFPKSVSETER